MQKKKLYRRIPRLDFMHTLFKGAIGKEYVIKHYEYGAIRTKYPDMSRIVPSAGQHKCRNMFREAVNYAKAVIADPVKKEAWQKKLRRLNGVYNAAITYYMQEARKQQRAQEKIFETNKLIRSAFKISGIKSVYKRKNIHASSHIVLFSPVLQILKPTQFKPELIDYS